MTTLTSAEQGLLRNAAGVGLKGGKPIRRNLSLFLSEQHPKEVADLENMGYLEPVHAGGVTTWMLTNDGIALGDANGWWPR